MVIAWDDNRSEDAIYAQRHTNNGDSIIAIGDNFKVNSDSGHYPSVAIDAGGAFTIVWEDHRYDYRDDPDVNQDIRELLDAVDHELATLRRQYKQKTKNYKQIESSLRDLNKRVKFFQVALDDEHAIDATGQIRRSR